MIVLNGLMCRRPRRIGLVLYFATIDALTEKQAKAIEAGVPTARVVRVPGSHYIFVSNESDVRHEMRKFTDRLEVAVAAGYSAFRGAPSAVV